MANNPHRPKLTPRMYRCWLASKINPLCRDKQGRWTPNGEPTIIVYRDVTINALIVRGLLQVVARQTVSRTPTAVKAAEEPV